jgi:taurine-pyruvate aminotransferase
MSREEMLGDPIKLDKRHVWHHLTQHKVFENSDPLMIVEGRGMRVTDINGKQYLDATSGGVWTVNVGYARQAIVSAIQEQLLKLPYFAATAGTVPGAMFAKALSDFLPGLEKIYYSNSGSEANEKAYKIVRQRAYFLNDGKKNKIIYRNRDYHGTTIAALSSTGQFERKNQYGPFVPGFVEIPHCCCYRCPFNKTYGECEIECAHVLEETILREGADSVGAIVLEPITAGGGIIIPVAEYFPIIQEICKKYDLLLHIDEVVCGMGRSGKWFGHQHYDVKPDIVTMAKGIASGYAAISITATTQEVFALFESETTDKDHYFRDISTFGGCTAGPAAAMANLQILKEEKLLENVNNIGSYLKTGLLELQEKYPIIGDVRGEGLLIGLELVSDRSTKQPVKEAVAMGIATHCLTNGLLIGRTNRSFRENNNVLILSPAFIITREDADIIISTLANALAEYSKDI